MHFNQFHKTEIDTAFQSKAINLTFSYVRNARSSPRIDLLFHISRRLAYIRYRFNYTTIACACGITGQRKSILFCPVSVSSCQFTSAPPYCGLHKNLTYTDYSLMHAKAETDQWLKGFKNEQAMCLSNAKGP